MKLRFISKGEWFDEGTECFLVDDIQFDIGGERVGLFSGIRTGHKFQCNLSDQITPDWDEEMCGFKEFEITEIEDEEGLPTACSN
jgi:hypothetical protein